MSGGLGMSVSPPGTSLTVPLLHLGSVPPAVGGGGSASRPSTPFVAKLDLTPALNAANTNANANPTTSSTNSNNAALAASFTASWNFAGPSTGTAAPGTEKLAAPSASLHVRRSSQRRLSSATFVIGEGVGENAEDGNEEEDGAVEAPSPILAFGAHNNTASTTTSEPQLSRYSHLSAPPFPGLSLAAGSRPSTPQLDLSSASLNPPSSSFHSHSLPASAGATNSAGGAAVDEREKRYSSVAAVLANRLNYYQSRTLDPAGLFWQGGEELHVYFDD
jgi:hypothetical protein